MIAGYFGSGAQGHPNMGYLLNGTSFASENFPGAVQTQVTGLNDNGVTAGFYSGMNAADMMNDNSGFVAVNGSFRTADFPAGDLASPPVDQLLGVNDNDVAVGFYTDAKGSNHGYEYHIGTHAYSRVLDPADPGASLTAAAINDHGDVAGFYTDAGGMTDGFVATPATASVAHLRLQVMPQGSATFAWADGQLTVQVNASGFTPGSSHAVELLGSDGTAIAQFGTLTANGMGQVQTTLTSTDTTPVPVGSQLVILLDDQLGAIASVPVAQTPAIASGQMSYQLVATEAGPTGTSYGTPQGSATVAYNPQARTITVTLTASGLTPGAHAAHIHVGSCASQGPVQYMLMDFTADNRGRIVNQVRTVTGVTSPVPATGWYLNLHQGTSANIVANGQPTVNFRPLLCANL